MNSIKTPKLCKNQQFLLKDRWENNHKCNHLAKNWTSIFLTNLLKIHYKLNFMPKFLHIYMHWIITLTLLIIYKWKIYDKPIRNYFFMNSSATIFFRLHLYVVKSIRDVTIFAICWGLKLRYYDFVFWFVWKWSVSLIIIFKADFIESRGTVDLTK